MPMVYNKSQYAPLRIISMVARASRGGVVWRLGTRLAGVTVNLIARKFDRGDRIY